MIASVRGRVTSLQPDGAVLEVGGVGLFVSCTPATLAGLRLGEEGRVATALVVREDSLTLYGFADDDERGVFELLQTASGVGPRLAQSVLAVHRPDAVRRAVATEDLAALTAVPGIGRKGAQRIVLELKDRIGPDVPSPHPVAGSGGPAWREQVRGALTGLGWSVREADEALAAVAPDVPADGAGAGVDEAAPDVAALLRAALQQLGRR